MRAKSDLFIPDFGYRLKQLLEEENISQSELARRINMSQALVNAYCNDRKYPCLESLIKICVVLGCSADYLLFGCEVQWNA